MYLSIAFGIVSICRNVIQEPRRGLTVLAAKENTMPAVTRKTQLEDICGGHHVSLGKLQGKQLIKPSWLGMPAFLM